VFSFQDGATREIRLSERSDIHRAYRLKLKRFFENLRLKIAVDSNHNPFRYPIRQADTAALAFLSAVNLFIC
jgi:hypothetical protein